MSSSPQINFYYAIKIPRHPDSDASKFLELLTSDQEGKVSKYFFHLLEIEPNLNFDGDKNIFLGLQPRDHWVHNSMGWWGLYNIEEFHKAEKEMKDWVSKNKEEINKILDQALKYLYPDDNLNSASARLMFHLTY